MRNRIVVVAGALLLLALPTRVRADSFGVMYEAVNNYSSCNGPSLTTELTNARNFRSSLTASGYWTAGAGWEDNNVYVSDFLDYNKTGNTTDNDNGNFDQLGNAFAYFSGHGVCDDLGDVNSQSCSTASDCTSPPAGTAMPSFCRFFNGDSHGNCMYHRFSRTLAVGNCSIEPTANGRANYSSGAVAFGESANSGTWAGAGTNGGINFAVMDISCSLLAYRESEAFPMFAGVHAVGFISRLTGDTAKVSDRGKAFADMFTANPNGAAPYAWAQSMANIASDPPDGSCRDLRGTNLGGGLGVNGCGMNEAVSMDSTSNGATGKTTQPWSLFSQDFRDAKGNSYWSEVYQCNWDCNNNPGRR